ncbi:ATP-binding protein [Devosia sp.]
MTLARLIARATMLAMLAVVLLFFVLRSGLPVADAILGWLVIAVTAALLPHSFITVETPAPVATATGISGLTVSGFAEALTDPCLVLDKRSIVRHRNAPAARKFPNVAIGNPVTFAMRNPELVQAIESVWRSGQTKIIELHETLPTETWERVAVAPLPSQHGEWLNDENPLLLITFQSLTELKRVEALRTDFIANASHELRTPLTSLLGFIDTLLGPAARDVAAREKFLLIMRGQAERMAKLIEDLLSLSRIEMHQHVRPTGSVDLVALLREVREGLQMQARAANVEITLDIPADAARTTGDRDELYEVFENLIENAIKYGGDGKTVELVLAASNLPGLAHQISVTDHGPGVEPEHVPRLTERFYRIDADTSRKKKGTGLGLAIAKHIVNRHRGQLAIRSRPGEGMRVDVSLP